MDKWQKLKGFLTDGKEHITKDLYVSRPSVFEEILDIMEELERREVSELEKTKAEIEEYMIISFCEDDDIKNIRKILDKHIAKLKGENNA